jgi:Sec-independent protein translocase protein TatA
MSLPDAGDLFVILFVLVLIFATGKLSWLADRIGRAVEGKGQGTAPPRADGASGKAERTSATPR